MQLSAETGAAQHRDHSKALATKLKVVTDGVRQSLGRAGPFECLGFLWSVSGDPDLVDHVSRLYRHCRASATADHEIAVWRGRASGVSVAVDGETVLADVAPGHAVAQLVWEVNRRASSSPSRLLVHAAAAQVDGEVLLLPGEKGSGKSTLVTGLVRSGLSYVTDEMTAVDPATGLVDRYAKPISLKEGSWGALADLASEDTLGVGEAVRQWLLEPDAVRGGSVAEHRGVATWIVFPAYREGVPVTLTGMTLAKAAIEICRCLLNFDGLGRGVLPMVANLARRCRCYELSYGELQGACDRLLGLIDGSDSCAPADQMTVEDRTVDVSAEVGSGAVPVRKRDVEWIELDGEALVHDRVGRTVHYLNATSLSVWAACDGRTSLREIAEGLANDFGADPSTVGIDTQLAVSQLIDAALVRMVEAR